MQMSNLYVYCGNNAVTRWDPSGEGWISDALTAAKNAAKAVINAMASGAKSAGNATNEAQKAGQRAFWSTGAQKYMREQKGYLTSAWMLEHSLQDMPANQYRDDSSRIAELMKNDRAFLDDLDEVMAKYGHMDSFTTERRNVEFNVGDLYYSIHGCGITYSGTKQSDGTWIISCRMDDVYDYTEVTSMMGKGISMGTTLGTVANDLAVFSQTTGAINEYEIVVDFQVKR